MHLNSAKLDSWAGPSYHVAHAMLHVTTTGCAAHDLHTTEPWQLAVHDIHTTEPWQLAAHDLHTTEPWQLAAHDLHTTEPWQLAAHDLHTTEPWQLAAHDLHTTEPWQLAAHDLHTTEPWQLAAHDLHTTEPWQLERTRWRQFAAQWEDCKDLKLRLSVTTILIMANIFNNDSKHEVGVVGPKAVLVWTCCNWLTHWHWSV